VHVDLDTLATALYVRIDDELKASPQLNRWRPKVGITPQITDAELITVSVMQALLGYHNESRWIRYARKSIIHLFPYLPKQPGYNKRLRSLGTQISHLIAVLVADTDLWQHPIRIADSTPGAVRHVPRDGLAFRVGRLGGLRLLRLALPAVLGFASAPGHHRARSARGVRPEQRQN
jgi:hypothetical protein